MENLDRKRDRKYDKMEKEGNRERQIESVRIEKAGTPCPSM